MAKDIRLITDINHNMSKMLKLGINYSNSCVGIWHIRGTLTPLKMYLLLTLHFCSSPCGPGLLGGRYDQGEIRKCLYHIPPPLASPCLYLPAVYIAPLDAGHLDKQDWITKKVVSVLLKSGQRLQVTPCKGRSQGNDHPDQYSPRM